AYLIVALVVALDLDLLVLHDDRTGGGLDDPGDSMLRTRCRTLLPPGVRVASSPLGARATILGALVAAREAAQARLTGEALPTPPGRFPGVSPLATPAPSAPQGRRLV
ncbi:MAG TPA: hypothetical protein VHN99_02560, partial [Deinococcales bacterium]|nr:hypothetical protein [Deinococcales bacterium]